MCRFSYTKIAFVALLIVLLGGAMTSAQVPTGVFFDDFNYASSSDPALAAQGWWVRTGNGGPGVKGCSWLAENITFLAEPGNPNNSLMQLAATTSGRGNNTSHAEIASPRKFIEGTFAARVRFSDAPISGPDGDQIVETFFTIADWAYARKPQYSELDFEYLPNGGWGKTEPTLWLTSWETANDNTSTSVSGSLAGWHTLVVVAMNGQVNYYLDGVVVVTHSGNYYPDGLQSINFNLWYIQGGLVKSSITRTYVEQVDWVYGVQNTALSPAQVEAAVAGYRSQGVVRLNTLP